MRLSKTAMAGFALISLFFSPVQAAAGAVEDFTFDPPDTGTLQRLSLWATWYYLPQVHNVDQGYALRAMDGAPLGPVLSQQDWCYSAMEGSVRVLDEVGDGITYNYEGVTSAYKVDCTKYYKANMGGTKFRKAHGAFGDGIAQYILLPYRTIAVDPTVIPFGKVIFVPSARGVTITLPDGRKVPHDGYFFAGDRGGLIKTNHIDVFIGVSTRNPFAFVKSEESGTFAAYLVEEEGIIAQLRDASLVSAGQ